MASAPRAKSKLLDFDLGASVFELLLERFGVGLGDGFLDGLRSAINEVLRFLQAQAGDGADNLNHFNLLVASGQQDDVELGLLFSSGSSSATSARSGDSQGSGGNAELLFERLDQVVQFHHGHRANGFEDVFFGNCHLKILQF